MNQEDENDIRCHFQVITLMATAARRDVLFETFESAVQKTKGSVVSEANY